MYGSQSSCCCIIGYASVIHCGWVFVAACSLVFVAIGMHGSCAGLPLLYCERQQVICHHFTVFAAIFLTLPNTMQAANPAQLMSRNLQK